MFIPVLTKAATKFHTAYDGHKAKAFKHEEAEMEKIYRIKGKGQWSLAKRCRKQNLATVDGSKAKT